jgi:hypothetical protein
VKTQLKSRTAGGLQSSFQNLRTTYQLKLPHPLRRSSPSSCLLKTEEEKKINTTQTPGKTMTELWLKYQHKDWMLKYQYQGWMLEE